MLAQGPVTPQGSRTDAAVGTGDTAGAGVGTSDTPKPQGNQHRAAAGAQGVGLDPQLCPHLGPRTCVPSTTQSSQPALPAPAIRLFNDVWWHPSDWAPPWYPEGCRTLLPMPHRSRRADIPNMHRAGMPAHGVKFCKVGRGAMPSLSAYVPCQAQGSSRAALGFARQGHPCYPVLTATLPAIC